MKLKKIVLPIIAMLCVWTAANAAESITSPDGNIIANVSSDDGHVLCSVLKNDTSVLTNTELGIVFENVDFTNEVNFVSRVDSAINETYPMVSGKVPVYCNVANEAVLTYEKQGELLDIYVRVYNDGVAFRYGYNKDTSANAEGTRFVFQTRTLRAWAMEYERCYEQFYLPHSLSELNGIYGMPLTVSLNDSLYAMIAEANLNSTYSGCVLDGDLKVNFEPKQITPVIITAPFLSPWRAVVIGTLNDIVNTQMLENLCDPCKIEDVSWIKPGVSSWTWFNGDPTNDPQTYKAYIDLAYEMGWQYVLLDEGWQPRSIDEFGRKSYTGTEDWVQDVINYAAERGIGVIVWSTYWDLDTPQKRTRLNEWAAMGIKGIKVDFFDNETQEMLRLYDDITEKTAQLHLMVNYHGCNKPTGERRTWSHLITREGVYGNEHFQSGGDWGPTAEHNCTLPFTRNAVGPMDYTPAITNYNAKNYFSAGQKAALPILFESGIQCFSDKPDNYRTSKLYSYLKNFPTTWDETKLLSGDIGHRVVMLRRKGNSYYVGVICNEQATEDVLLDFLDTDVAYRAEIYRDGVTDTELISEVELVHKNDVITIPELTHGGAAIKITPLGSGVLSDTLGHWSEPYVMALNNQKHLNGYFGIEFKPDAFITRGEFVMMFLSAMGIEMAVDTPAFADSVASRYKNYVATAVRLGIINGVSETEFAPDDLITREQAATIIGRYKHLAGGIILNFDDSDLVSNYAKMYVSVCAQKGIIKGYEDGTFRPQKNITRAETATILSKCMD